MIDAAKRASLDQIASAVPSLVADGPAAGCRAIDVRVWHGIDLRVLPDRGLDVGAAWFRGVPLAWLSENGEQPPAPVDDLVGARWGALWPGGLVTTCGLSNVGAPSGGLGLHGTYSHRRADEVRIDRTDERVAVTGVVRDEPFRVERRIETRVGDGVLTVLDHATNESEERVAAPLLYHVNVGAPVWDEGASLSIEGSVAPRDAEAAAGLATWSLPPEPSPDAPERVFEHVLPGPGVSARLTSPRAGVELVVESTLPRLWQWVHPASGTYALGIEPANCSVAGREADLAAGRMPMLGPGETRTTSLTIRARYT